MISPTPLHIKSIQRPSPCSGHYPYALAVSKSTDQLGKIGVVMGRSLVQFTYERTASYPLKDRVSIAKSELPQKVQINIIDGKIRHEKLSRARRRYMLSLLRFIIAYTAFKRTG